MSSACETTSSDVQVLAQLDQVLARLEAQEQRIRSLETAAAAPLTATAPVALPSARESRPRLGRRNLLTKALAATAAAALLTMAKGAAPASADTRTTLTAGGASTANYGILSTYDNATDPLTVVPLLNNYPFGIIGSTFPNVNAPLRGAGIYGCGNTFDGVLGTSNTAAGVYAMSNVGQGVVGRSTAADSGQPGVFGQSTSGPGVYGLSSSNAGVFAQSTGGIALAALSSVSYGVYAKGGSNQPSLFGDSSSSTGTGVYGFSPNNAGVFGESFGNIGVFGRATTGSGVVGLASAGGLAGQFFGNVNIVGSLTVSGSFPKSAGVPHPDGSVRRVYCMEAPESVFEDFGRAQLQNGQASVKLDPEFAALVTANDYAVFLQPEGPTPGLYVGQRTPTGFEVHEQDDGPSSSGGAGAGRERSIRLASGAGGSVSFSYRVVAKRKDVVGKVSRLERIAMPKLARRDSDRGLAADTDRLPSVRLPDAPPVPPTLDHDEGPRTERER